MRNISIALTNKGLVFKLFLLFLFLSPIGGYAQKNLNFSKDSIPVVNGEVVFSVIFEYDLDKVEFMKRSVAYLNGKLEPYSGLFLASNRDFNRLQDNRLLRSRLQYSSAFCYLCHL